MSIKWTKIVSDPHAFNTHKNKNIGFATKPQQPAPDNWCKEKNHGKLVEQREQEPPRHLQAGDQVNYSGTVNSAGKVDITHQH